MYFYTAETFGELTRASIERFFIQINTLETYQDMEAVDRDKADDCRQDNAVQVSRMRDGARHRQDAGADARLQEICKCLTIAENSHHFIN